MVWKHFYTTSFFAGLRVQKAAVQIWVFEKVCEMTCR